MKVLQTRITGTSPLIMHSDRGTNPLLDEVKAHKELTSKRKKTDEDHRAIAFSEWNLALYYDAKIGPHIPAMNMRACLVGGAKFNKLGAAVKRSTVPTQELLPLEYDGPRDKKKMFENPNFVDCRSVVVSQSRVMRTRPIFRSWAFDFDLMYDENQLEPEQLVLALENAGILIGLADYRPEKGGLFGRFEVAVR